MTVYNTADKIARRNIIDLEDLTMATLESSNVINTLQSDVELKIPDRISTNTMTKIARRKISELNGLLINIVEASKRGIRTGKDFKVVLPRKAYTAVLNVNKKYNTNIKG